jgi:hypothetical protein
MNTSSTAIDLILQTEDVEGLIEIGAPSDEYVSEAQEIAEAISKLSASQVTAENIVAIISLAWAKSFNRSAEEIKERLPAFHRIARQILAQG